MRPLRPSMWYAASELPILLALVTAACDTRITNPGLTPDDSLNLPSAWPAVIVGARRALANAIGSSAPFGGQLLYWGAAVSFEINPAGSTGSFGILPNVQAGQLDPVTSDADWASSNQARFVPEDALRRFRRVMPDAVFNTSVLVAQAYLYAGYANRLLGENFCESVIPTLAPDSLIWLPGQLGLHTAYLQRADTHFTNAIRVAAAVTGKDTTLAKTIRLAALAGRASVRADLATYGLASWSDATTDAGGVSSSFTFTVPYSAASEDQYNYLYWARGDNPYRAHTQWGTFYELYYRATKDPRTPWDSTSKTGDATVARFGGKVPFWPEAKHAARDAPVRLSSDWEMRLIEAEAALAAGDLGAALTKMNIRRAALRPVQPPITATTLEEGWTALKQERAVELWLEARRLGDLRRWIENNIPGDYPDGLYQDTNADGVNDTRTETMTAPVARSLCFPVGQSEHETNPNVP